MRSKISWPWCAYLPELGDEIYLAIKTPQRANGYLSWRLSYLLTPKLNRCNGLSCSPGQLVYPGGKLSRDILPPPWLSSPPGVKMSRPVYLAPNPYRGNNLIWCLQFICNILWYLHVFLKLQKMCSKGSSGLPCSEGWVLGGCNKNCWLSTLFRVGCKMSRLVYLAPRPGFGSNSVVS